MRLIPGFDPIIGLSQIRMLPINVSSGGDGAIERTLRMTLLACTECGRQISSLAAACPGCGARPAKPGRAMWVGWQTVGLFGIVLITAIVAKCTDSTSSLWEQVQPSEIDPAIVGIPISPTAIIVPSGIMTSKFIGGMVAVVKLEGFRCDSVDAASKDVFGPDLYLKCNGYRYKYKIHDRGGHWQVTVD